MTQRRAAVSLEFAIIAVPFLTLALGVMEIGYDLYVQAALDNAVHNAARSVQVGTTSSTGESSSALVQAAVCPNLHELLDCNYLIVGVTPLPSGSGGGQYDYYTAPSSQSITGLNHYQIPFNTASSGTGDICTGSSGQLMLLQAWYLGPSFVGGLIPAFVTQYLGNTPHITQSSAGFVDETGISGASC
ncbi:MAG TPA: TadE/TadG family type IV pilus assembly protein [Acetobacteraceae bacterium]|nr:TadE/TadG family type IV pilus assembly protein [Acetobacteraceae bacterium]